MKRLIKKVIVQDVPFVDYFEYLLKYKTSLTKLIEYSLIYFVSIHGFGYGWIILVFLLLALQDFQRSDESAEGKCAKPFFHNFIIGQSRPELICF